MVGQTGEHAYIGAAVRHDEDADVEHILLYGAKFPLAAALLLPVSKRYSADEADDIHIPETESF